MKSKNFLYSLASVILTSFLVSVFIVFAADPGAPFTPGDNVQDPGDPGTGWGGCGPTDPNCYVTISAGATALSDLVDAEAVNTLDSLDYAQEWQWSTLAGGSGLKLSSTSTDAIGDTQKLLEVSLSGLNDNASETTYAGHFSNTHTGATSTNVGLYATASGGTTNYAIESDGVFLLDALAIQNIGTRSLSIGAGTPAVTDSFFFGTNAGATATGANNSIFIGPEAGESATNSFNAVFLGFQAGETATTADYSVFIGDQAGEDSTNANEAVYIGRNAGQFATNAENSVFLGEDAGQGAVNASESIFIGTTAGDGDTVSNDNTKYSILIGPATSTGGFSSSIAMGRGATNTASNQLVFGSSTGGINFISDVYFGTGVTAASPAGVVINGSGASGSDIAGASLTFAGGKATGNAAGGALIFQTSNAGASGATLQSLSTKATLLASGNFGIGDTTPASMLTVGNGDLFQVASDGSIDAITGYIQGSGTMSLTSANTTQTTTNSILAVNGNSLTTGTGLYVASSTLTFGSLVNLVSTSTGANADLQKILNISTSGANVNNGQTTYGGYVSNTHTGGASENIGVYSTSSGATYNKAFRAVASGGTYAIGISASASGGTNNYAVHSDGPILLGGEFANNMTIQYLTGDTLSIDAGTSATGSNNSYFIGEGAATNATNSDNAIFFGMNAGHSATNATGSVFLGNTAGREATNADFSYFIGYLAGYQATNAGGSVFLGSSAGEGATNAENSIFIGNNAGLNDTVDNVFTSGSSILIGNNTSTGGFSHSVAIGPGATNTDEHQVVFGSDINPLYDIYLGGNGASNTGYAGLDYTIHGSTPGAGLISENLGGGDIALAGGKATGNAVGGSIVFQTSDAGASGSALQALTTKAIILPSGNFGISNTNPGVALHVGSASTTDGTTLLRLQDANTTCNFTADAGAPTCGSDRRLKKDIEELSTEEILAGVIALEPVSYHWKTDESNDPLQYGFIAQNVQEQFPNLVKEGSWIDGSQKLFLSMGGLMPYAIGAIKELNLKLNGIQDFADEDNSFGNKLRDWFGSSTNGIRNLFVKDTVCIGETCINEEQLKALIENMDLNTGNENQDNDTQEEDAEENTEVEEDDEDVTIEESNLEEEIIIEEENTNDEPEEIINQENEQTNEENQSSN